MKTPAHTTPDDAAPERGGIAALLLAALGAVAWLAGVAVFGAEVPIVLFAPAALVAATAGAFVGVAAAMGWPRAIAALVVLIAVGLSIAFRTREAGDTGLDIQNGIKLLVWLLLPLIAFINARRILFFFRDPLIAMTALYTLTAVASGLWSPTPAYTSASALGLGSYLLLACLAVAILGQTALLRLLVFTLMVYAAMTLATAVLLPGTAWMALADGNPVPRLQGLSGHPNVLGEQMAVLTTLTAIARREQLIGRPLFLLGTAAGLGILFATESRTTLLAVLASWGLVAARQRGLLVPVLVIGALAAGGAVIAGALGRDPLPQELLAALSRSGSPSELGTLTGRTDLWEVSAVLIGERPLLGWGFNGTEELLVASVGRGFIGDPVNAHNMYIQSVLSLGFLGSLPFFVVLAVLIGRMIVVPDPARDQFVLLVLVIGLAEVALCATPTLLTLVFFVFIAFEALNGRSPATPRPHPVSGNRFMIAHPDLTPLEQLGTRSVPPATPGGVDAFMVVRNEIERLPDILDHHRRLGVERFFITDNGSRDGTGAYLQQQPDCVVHQTDASFAAANWGMDWINALVRRHGQGRWCLFIDADELFVYPHAEAVTLPEFCRFLTATGAQGVFALMVDMYAPGPIDTAAQKSGERLVDVCPLYDSDYRLRRKVASPLSRSFHNVEAMGGPRQRVFYPEFSGCSIAGATMARGWRVLRHSSIGSMLRLDRTRLGIYPPEITKIPLIHAGPDRWWTTNHRTTPLVLSPVTAALLHFKLLASFAERARAESRRKEHWGGATEYARYAALLERQPELGFVYGGSRRYSGPDDLMRDGVIRSSAAFDAFAGHPPPDGGSHPVAPPREPGQELPA